MNATEAGLAAYAIRFLLSQMDDDLETEAAQESRPASQENGTALPDVRAVAERLLVRLDRQRRG